MGNEIIFDAVRSMMDSQGFNKPGRVETLNAAIARLLAANGVATVLPAPPPSPAPVAPVSAPSPQSWDAILARLTNVNAPALTDADFERVATELGVSSKFIRAVKKVEAPRGAFDDQGRPSILYEKHVFSRNTGHRFDGSHPVLSAPKWQPGTYGGFGAQYGKLAQAYALDPDAAFKACSFGAFQIVGENAVALGYSSALEMAIALAASEAAHLDSFVRFVKTNGLVDELRACRAGDPASCIPFVRAYNGAGFARNNYHVNLANAAK